MSTQITISTAKARMLARDRVDSSRPMTTDQLVEHYRYMHPDFPYGDLRRMAISAGFEELSVYARAKQLSGAFEAHELTQISLSVDDYNFLKG